MASNSRYLDRGWRSFWVSFNSCQLSSTSIYSLTITYQHRCRGSRQRVFLPQSHRVICRRSAVNRLPSPPWNNRAPLQHITIAELPRGMAIARAVLAKFKEIFISGQLKVIPLFRILCFTNSRLGTRL